MAKQQHTTTDIDNYEELFGTCTSTPEPLTAQQPNVSSPALRGPGIYGEDHRVLPCLIDRVHDSDDNLLEEVKHPVSSEAIKNPKLARLIRDFEFRPMVNLKGETGLVARELPRQDDPGESWTLSAHNAVMASVGNWGRISPDLEHQVYLFEPFAHPPSITVDMPDLEGLMVTLLGDFVIDTPNHPVVLGLLGGLHNWVQVDYDSDTAAETAGFKECSEEVDLDLM